MHVPTRTGIEFVDILMIRMVNSHGRLKGDFTYRRQARRHASSLKCADAPGHFPLNSMEFDPFPFERLI